jgi:Outer membrane protein beta-barrel domain
MRRSTLALALLAASAAANAGNFDYNYVSLGYGNTELDDVDVDGDGFGVTGSFALTDSYHLFAGYETADFDYGVDASTIALGMGFNSSLSPVVDVVARLSYQYVEVDAPGFGSVDDNGLGIGVGLRFLATPKLELDAGIDYVDLNDSGDDTSFGAGGLYSFTNSFALGLSGNWGDDASSYTVSGRFYFGK